MYWLKYLFHKKHNLEINQKISKLCEYNSVSECPYSDNPRRCNFDKANCILAFELKNKKPRKNTSQTLYIVGLSSLLIYTLISLCPKDLIPKIDLSNIINILTGVSLSVFAGSVLALFIDIPSRLKEYEASFINALASNAYLKTLDEPRLTKLRKDITEQLHNSKVPNMAKGLIDFDQKILDLLRQPYYHYYRHSVVCELIEDGTKYKKKHIIDYKLINPYSVNRKVIEYIKLRNYVLLNSNEEEAVSNLEILCQIDNEENKDLQNKIKIKKLPIQDDFYTHKFILQDNSDDETSDGIKVEFSDHIKVRISYEIKVSIHDPCFTKRLQHPARNFRLDYSCDDSITLFGQIVGTQLSQSDISIIYSRNKRHICLETFNWLLPTNGAIVMMLKE